MVKSNIIRDKNADKINNFKFDAFNILLTIVLLIDIFITILRPDKHKHIGFLFLFYRGQPSHIFKQR